MDFVIGAVVVGLLALAAPFLAKIYFRKKSPGAERYMWGDYWGPSNQRRRVSREERRRNR